MRFSRLLLPTLSIFLWAAPSVTQSPVSPQNRFSSSPLLNGQVPTQTYRLHSHSVAPFIKDGAAPKQVQAAPGFKAPKLFDQPENAATLPKSMQSTLKFENPHLLDDSPALRSGVLASKLGNPPAINQRCYTLRQYQFEQVDPKSDVTRFKDYSACQPSAQFRLKGATLVPTPSR